MLTVVELRKLRSVLALTRCSAVPFFCSSPSSLPLSGCISSPSSLRARLAPAASACLACRVVFVAVADRDKRSSLLFFSQSFPARALPVLPPVAVLVAVSAKAHDFVLLLILLVCNPITSITSLALTRLS
eukprot:764610-Hanusia_phi.AAC.1